MVEKMNTHAIDGGWRGWQPKTAPNLEAGVYITYSRDGEFWFNVQMVFKGRGNGLRSPDYPVDGALFANYLKAGVADRA